MLHTFKIYKWRKSQILKCKALRPGRLGRPMASIAQILGAGVHRESIFQALSRGAQISLMVQEQNIAPSYPGAQQ